MNDTIIKQETLIELKRLVSEVEEFEKQRQLTTFKNKKTILKCKQKYRIQLINEIIKSL